MEESLESETRDSARAGVRAPLAPLEGGQKGPLACDVLARRALGESLGLHLLLPSTAHTGCHPGTHTGLPWGPARCSAPIRPSRWLGTSSSSLPVTMVTRLRGRGETLFSSALSVAPCGLCQNLPTTGKAGSEGPARHTGSGSVCVWEGGVTLAAATARGSPREAQGRAGELAGPGRLASPQAPQAA